MRLPVAKYLVATAIVFLGIAAFGQSLPVQQALPSKQSGPEKKAAPPPPKHKIGPFEISINWRTRAEGWNWFEGKAGNSDYPLWDSLLRIGIGQTRERVDWFAELEQASILRIAKRRRSCGPARPTGVGRDLLRGQPQPVE